MFRKFINIFYPFTCPLCGEILSGKRKICRECEKSVKLIREPKCQKCGKALNTDERIYCNDCKNRKRHFEQGVAVFEHQGKLRESIYRFKYDNARFYAQYYAEETVKMYGTLFRKWKIDAIVPVPVHKVRELKRGYNQALVFAEAVAERVDIPVEKRLMIRTKNTVPQKELEGNMRYLNLQNAFAVDCERIKGIQNILLVDDIFTTGSTVDACSAILKKAGAKKVYVLCISAGMD